DVTSLYPYTGTKDLPHGIPKFLKEDEMKVHYSWDSDLESWRLKDDFYGFVEVEFRHHPKLFSKPDGWKEAALHGLKIKTAGTYKLSFPHILDYQKAVIFSEEIKMSQRMGLSYQYEF